MIKAKKSLGQNFLHSKSIVEKIVRTANVTKEDTILEIGPGLGILTEELANKSNRVIAVELDSSFIPILKINPLLEKVEIINQDALTYIPKFKNYKIVANIPYYITSPLITHFLTQKNPPKTITLLVQKEVAKKICAQTKYNPKEHHSILSLQTQLYATPNYAFEVGKGNFNPQPNVDSAVIHLSLLPKDQKPKDPERILTLAKKAFSGKRKKLSNTLGKTINLPAKFKDLRPEHLSIKDWEELAKQTLLQNLL